MSPSKRQQALVALIAERDSNPDILHRADSRSRWLGKAVPLLSFNPELHQDAKITADLLVRPGFSQNHYEQAEARIVILVRQAITELQHGIGTPVIDDDKVDPKHTLISCWRKASWSLRIKLFGYIAAVFATGFMCGRVQFFTRLHDLLKEILP